MKKILKIEDVVIIKENGVIEYHIPKYYTGYMLHNFRENNKEQINKM